MARNTDPDGARPCQVPGAEKREDCDRRRGKPTKPLHERLLGALDRDLWRSKQIDRVVVKNLALLFRGEVGAIENTASGVFSSFPVRKVGREKNLIGAEQRDLL